MPYLFKVGLCMEKFETQVLDQNIVDWIKEFCKVRLDELEKTGFLVNNLIREDIFPMLDRFCTVVYYPIDDGINNGFHKTYLINGKKAHFVYINTNQDREKQIFTAAHELGHVWNLDKYIADKLNTPIEYEFGERVMNRFAAELLMPYDLFMKFVDEELDKILRGSESASFQNIIQLITTIMNEFFVPYKSVVYRMYELKYIKEPHARILWGDHPNLSRELITEYSKQYAKEQGYNRLYNPDKTKLIMGLKEDLDIARKESLVPDQWALEFYKRFSLSPDEPNSALNAEIDIMRGVDTNAADESSCN